MKQEDDELRERFGQMADVPFGPDLMARIRDAARAEQEHKRVRFFIRSRSMFAALGASVAAMGLIWGTWTYADRGTGMAHVNQSLQQVNDTATQASLAQGNEMGLLIAPLSISVWVGDSVRYGANRMVYAALTNVGTQTIEPKDIIGVLTFQKQSGGATLSKATWMTFVNAPWHQAIAPGQTINWSFHPVGAPATAQGALTQTPTLTFFMSHLVPVEKADVIWQKPDMTATDIKVTPRSHWQGGQSIGVSALLKNRSNQPIDIHQVLGIVWFSKGLAANWTTADVVRFVGPLDSVRAGSAIDPGQSIPVYSSWIGSDTTDFLGMIPHVDLIVRSAQP